MKREINLIKELVNVLQRSQEHHEYCGYGRDSWERECAGNLEDEINSTLEMANKFLDNRKKVFCNNCHITIPEALRYLAKNKRPTGGEERFNAIHLYELANEAERFLSYLK